MVNQRSGILFQNTIWWANNDSELLNCYTVSDCSKSCILYLYYFLLQISVRLRNVSHNYFQLSKFIVVITNISVDIIWLLYRVSVKLGINSIIPCRYNFSFVAICRKIEYWQNNILNYFLILATNWINNLKILPPFNNIIKINYFYDILELVTIAHLWACDVCEPIIAGNFLIFNKLGNIIERLLLLWTLQSLSGIDSWNPINRCVTKEALLKHCWNDLCNNHEEYVVVKFLAT